MQRRWLAALVLALSFGACGPEAAAPAGSPSAIDTAQDPAIAPVTPLDYANLNHWLCRPGRDDACAQDASVTTVPAYGEPQQDAFVPALDPPIDCFYVYPTISKDDSGNADTAPGPEEREIARQQFARFGAACRLYAPAYRQVTLTALYKLRRGETVDTNREMAFADVKAAWQHYLANDNAGRGVVLIGHDQGAGILTRLITSSIDGQPIRDQIVSAILVGGAVETPKGQAVGGTFRTLPLCAAATSTGCVIAYSAFRAEAPPSGASLFGAASTTGNRAACVNPAELDGSAGELRAMLPSGDALFDDMAAPPVWSAAAVTPIETPFVMLPGLLHATCVEQDGFSYLAVTVTPDPADPRTDTINGDVVVNGSLRPFWGLHLIDMHLALGDLVSIVSTQAAEWIRLQSSASVLPPGFHQDQ
jgi:hypothetical protein